MEIHIDLCHVMKLIVLLRLSCSLKGPTPSYSHNKYFLVVEYMNLSLYCIFIYYRCMEDEQMLDLIRRANPNCGYMYVVDTRPRVSKIFFKYYLYNYLYIVLK